MAGAKAAAAGEPDVAIRGPECRLLSKASFPGLDSTIRTAEGRRMLPIACVTAWLSLAIHIAMLPEAGQEPQWATRPHS